MPFPHHFSSPFALYVASKTRHAPRWIALRERFLNERLCGRPWVAVASTWIDEAEPGATKDKSDLYRRCINEASRSRALFAYAEPGEVMRGAFIEMGATLAMGGKVVLVGPLEAYTFIAHPNVTHVGNSFEDGVEAVYKLAEKKL